MSVESSVVRIPKIDGKREIFAVWFSQFQAVCTMEGTSEAPLELFKNELPTSESEQLDLSDESDEKKQEAKVTNNLAMSFLILSAETPQLMSKINAMKSKEWPNGLLCTSAYRV